MEPFKTFASVAVPIDIANCDTDQIIPRGSYVGARMIRSIRGFYSTTCASTKTVPKRISCTTRRRTGMAAFLSRTSIGDADRRGRTP